LLRLLRLAVRDVDGGRGGVHRCDPQGGGSGAYALPRGAARRRLGVSVPAVPEGRHRHGLASPVPGTRRAHEPAHGPDRGAREEQLTRAAPPAGDRITAVERPAHSAPWSSLNWR